ncbi:substrate-binding domain-containing protein [Azospirillum sp. ST 5-10]|uniref:substrate-binding domain-containing protein n=1 Tax=unclassified Azospirillum TaxID=2630922 RepID=UPI003F4A7955
MPDAAGPPACRRRTVLAGLAAGATLAAAPVHGGDALRFGLTPVFLDSDTALLAALERYLGAAMGRPVALVQRRTYQEITTLLLTGNLDAAWICGFPFVQYRPRLALVAVPLYRGRPLYQSYLIVGAGGPVAAVDDLRGTVHAFSDPDSNSGFLVTQHLLATRGETPASFFRRSFFTYGHRNVVRAVSSGLAEGGSVDGYVWDVMAEVEPALVAGTRVLRRSPWLGFPPVACPAARRDGADIAALRRALVSMADHPAGRDVLALLRLDGFTAAEPSLFEPIAAMYDAVRAHT